VATDERLRHFLIHDEVRALLCAAKKNRRNAARNYAMILLAYRHGLRASEVVDLRVCDIDFRTGTILCRRRKHSKSTIHPMKQDEIAALERVMRGRQLAARDAVVWLECGEKLTKWGSWRIVSDAGKRAGLPVTTYAHQLRQSCGDYLANRGCDLRLIQDDLGPMQIQSTVRHTALNAKRFVGPW
jgi:site-specific recombinase XerD